jgi:hypothetical protein
MVRIIMTLISFSSKVIVVSLLIGFLIVCGCTSTGQKDTVSGKYLSTAPQSTSYMDLKSDGTCYLCSQEKDNFKLGFNCTYTVQEKNIHVCYPEQNICENWILTSPGEISSPAGYHAKKVS